MSFISKSVTNRQYPLNMSFIYFGLIYYMVNLQHCTSLLSLLHVPPSHKDIFIPLSLVHLIYTAGDKCMHQNACFRRDWHTNKCSNMLNILTNGYILPFITNPKLARVPLIYSGYKAHQDTYAVSSAKEPNRKGGNVKSLGFYNHLFSSPEASPRVEASDRPKQAQYLSTCRKV